MSKPEASKHIKSGTFTFEPTVSASRARVYVRLVCQQDRAMDQTWTYLHNVARSRLDLVSVCSSDSTEIERDPKLRDAVRRLAAAAWSRSLHDLPSMS